MIGLFLGDTDFSEIVLKKIKKLKKKYFIIDFSKNNKFKKDKNSYRVSIGKFGKIIKLIKEKNSKKVLFAGKIAKPNFSSLTLDFKGIYYMPSVIRASKIGDASIIKSIINKKNSDLNSISDLAAVRIITKSTRDCYKVLGIIHRNFSAKIGRTKDYISNPKPNGYRSIHTDIIFNNKV